ncbi:dienelactone hydrolase [Achromatium sp. WMS2]|nr:dienelactone hydrolase [Achromatium sp. WMS2]
MQLITILQRLSIAALLLAANTVAVQAEIHTEVVEYEVDGKSHTGYLAYDTATPTPRPGVLVVHEWWGLGAYEQRRARMLAELGYAAFAVDMYGTGKLTSDRDQAREWMQNVTTDVEWWRSIALEGIDVLQHKANVDPRRIAAIGYCFGGGTVLQLAYGGADLVGIVSFHGSLPAAPATAKIKSKILVINAYADPFLPRDVVSNFQSALEKTGADWQMIEYGGGVLHSFTNPDADNHNLPVFKYDAVADQRSWSAMLTFLQEVLHK